MRQRRTKAWLAALLCGGMPLVTIGTCDPRTGFLDIYRDDDADYVDVWVDEYVYEDPYYYDYYYYDEYYYDDDCWLCW